MKSLLKTLFVAFALTVVLLSGPATANAQRSPYWHNHWGWYDNTYRPYYNNYYYGGYGRPYYNGYYNNGYYNGYYGNGYYGPNVYVNPGVGVNVGRLNFGWW